MVYRNSHQVKSLSCIGTGSNILRQEAVAQMSCRRFILLNLVYQ